MLVDFLHVDLFFPDGVLQTDGVVYNYFDTFISDDNTLKIVTKISGLRVSEGISLLLKDYVPPGKQKIHIHYSKPTQFHEIIILKLHSVFSKYNTNVAKATLSQSFLFVVL